MSTRCHLYKRNRTPDFHSKSATAIGLMFGPIMIILYEVFFFFFFTAVNYESSKYLEEEENRSVGFSKLRGPCCSLSHSF